jgi:hypothetical protein
MLDYLALICLLALCIGHFYLIRGCFGIKTEADNIGGIIHTNMAESNNLLNEIAEYMSELNTAQPASAHEASGNPLMNLLLQSLIPKPKPTEVHGSQEEWTVPTFNTEDSQTEENEHSGFVSESVSDERNNAGLV